MSHATHKRVISHANESFHKQMSDVTRKKIWYWEVCPLSIWWPLHKWVMSHKNESFHTQMSHFTRKWVKKNIHAHIKKNRCWERCPLSIWWPLLWRLIRYFFVCIKLMLRKERLFLSREQAEAHTHTHIYKHMHIHTHTHARMATGWRRLMGSPKLQIIFHKKATKYRSLLRKMAYKDKGS